MRSGLHLRIQRVRCSSRRPTVIAWLLFDGADIGPLEALRWWGQYDLGHFSSRGRRSRAPAASRQRPCRRCAEVIGGDRGTLNAHRRTGLRCARGPLLSRPRWPCSHKLTATLRPPPAPSGCVIITRPIARCATRPIPRARCVPCRSSRGRNPRSTQWRRGQPRGD